MDTFADALLSRDTGRIPEGRDWFAPLLGDWDCDYFDVLDGAERRVKGEWMFRRVLDGAGIQDVFIFPSRATRETSPQPDAEYGSSLRMYNAAEDCYDVCYACDRCMVRLRFTREGGSLVGRNLDCPGNFWIFSELTGGSFLWENVTAGEDGTRTLVCRISGRRIR